MKLRTSLFVALSLASATALGLVACSSSDSGTPDTSGAAGGTSVPSVTPPPPSSTAVAGDGTGSTVWAISKLQLGDTDASGASSTTAWKTLGYDIDGKQSNAKSTDVCKPAGNGTASVHNNGPGGVDNSFGANILPIITGLISNPSDEVNTQITDGKFTIMIKVDKLGSGTDYKDLTAAIFGGGDLGGSPKFDGTDKWPVLCELLGGCDYATMTKGDITKPKVAFPTSYVAGNTWVSGSKGDIDLALSIKGVTLDLVIHQAVITAKLAADHKSGTGGIISGVLNTQQLVDTITGVVGKVEPSLCGSQTVTSILPTIIGASDIMQDGTQDPAQTCDGISVGLGFEAKEVQLGDVTDPAAPASGGCDADGGTGSDADTTGDAAAE